MKKYFLFFLPFLSLDILTKVFATQHIPQLLPKLVGYPYGGIAVFNWSACSFSLNTIYNSGAAWGIFQGYSGLLFIGRALVIVGLLVYLFSTHRRESESRRLHWDTLPLWLVAVGAIGNSIDYLVYGKVVDFLHFCFGSYSFPIFNFADCYITVGIFALFFFPRKAASNTLQ